jgi:hypothetical protein
MPAVGNKTCICGKTVQAKGYLRHLGRCDKVKAAQSRTQGTIFAARVEDVDAIEDADDMDDEDMDDEDMDEDGLLAKRARPAAQPIGGLGAIVPGACTTPAHSCTPLSAAGGFGGQGGVSGVRSTTPATHGYLSRMPAAGGLGGQGGVRPAPAHGCTPLSAARYTLTFAPHAPRSYAAHCARTPRRTRSYVRTLEKFENN